MEDNGADIQVAATLNRSLRRLNSRAPEKQRYCSQRIKSPAECSIVSLLTLAVSKMANDEGI